MARIIIELDVPGEISDPEHSTGLTDEGHGEVMDALIEVGGTNIDIRPAEGAVGL